jgi:hypothetical protein
MLAYNMQQGDSFETAFVQKWNRDSMHTAFNDVWGALEEGRDRRISGMSASGKL